MRHKPSRRQRLFLAALRSTLGVAPAADAAGVSRATVYRWRTEDTDFAKAWDDAVEGALDDLEAALHERAKTKDTLAGIALLRNRRRQIYNDVAVQNAVTVQVAPIQLSHNPQDMEALAGAMAILLQSGAAAPPTEKVIEADVADVPKLPEPDAPN
jgi:hypothetical protein